MRLRPILAAVLALCLILTTACGGSIKGKTRAELNYAEIHNTGLANDCFELPESARGTIPLEAGGSYKLVSVCMHPTDVLAKVDPLNKRQEARFVDTKILTRNTSTIEEIYGDLDVGEEGLTFSEQGGIDFQLITVLLPGGEEVPFVFSSKALVAEADADAITTSTDFAGTYRVPSYRTSNFLDPKGRGLTTGYGSAVGLVPAGDDEELDRENTKRYVEGQGSMSLSITRVDGETGEFVGRFTALQTSDTDMGSKDPIDLQVSGQLYGRVEQA